MTRIKRCALCKVERPVEDYRVKNRQLGKLAPRCKDCEAPARRAESSRRYGLKRGQILDAQRRAYPSRKEKVAAWSRQWVKANPEKSREYSKAWAERHPARASASWAAQNHKARGKAYNTPGYATLEQVMARRDYFGGRCWMCGGVADQMDHVIPIAAGGSNWPANLRPACRRCNRAKGSRRVEVAA